MNPPDPPPFIEEDEFQAAFSAAMEDMRKLVGQRASQAIHAEVQRIQNMDDVRSYIEQIMLTQSHAFDVMESLCDEITKIGKWKPLFKVWSISSIMLFDNIAFRQYQISL